MADHAMPRTLCPGCGADHDHATNAEGKVKAKPDIGDYTICLNCGEILCFDKDFRLVKEESMRGLDGHQRSILMRAQRHIRSRGPLPRMAEARH